VGARVPVRHRAARARGDADGDVTLTPSQTVGPFFALGLREAPRLVAAGEPGAVRLEGVVYDGAGDPVPDAVVEIWQADRGLWGRCCTDAGGRYGFLTVKPGPV